MSFWPWKWHKLICFKISWDSSNHQLMCHCDAYQPYCDRPDLHSDVQTRVVRLVRLHIGSSVLARVQGTMRPDKFATAVLVGTRGVTWSQALSWHGQSLIRRRFHSARAMNLGLPLNTWKQQKAHVWWVLWTNSSEQIPGNIWKAQQRKGQRWQSLMISLG